MTRRILLGQLASIAAWAQGDDDPLRQLRAAHPRLILLDADLDRLKVLIRDNPLAHRIYLDLEKESDRLLTTPVSEYKLVGPRLRAQTRKILDRVSTLALMYRLTLREPYLRRAVGELRASASFRDWNPAVFTDTAEMAHAFALGYDWLYNSLSSDERAWIREAISSKALDQAMPIYQREGGWPHDRFNANMICNAGVGLAALAIAGDKIGEADISAAGQSINDKCGAVLRNVFESIPHGLASYGVEGSWPEGMAYWESVTRYACAFFSALQTALGNDYGLSAFHGVDRAGRYRIHMTGPSGKVFNFADSTDDIGLSPEMFWMAKRFSVPQYAWSEQKAIERSTHPDAYDLAWFDANAKSPQQPAPPSASWPLDAIFRGVDIACFRSAWDDPNALYLAVKGGDNKDPHAHLDMGSFVLDAGGVRWAADLGADDYDLPGYLGKQRWSYYRTRTESHNTLLIEDQNQDLRAEARITRQEFTPDFSWVQIDLSRVYPGKVKQWTRRFALAQRQAILIGDSVRSDQPVEVIWGMMTDADIVPSGQTATLRKNGWTLTAEIRSPRHAVFDVAPIRSTPPQAPNPNFRKLIVRLGDKVTELDLNIVLTPYKDGQTKPKVVAQFPA
jgi:Heparinase II/III-like protein